jgi:hypothetical protein
VGPDGLPAEAWSAVSLELVLVVLAAFNGRLDGSEPGGNQWQELEFFGIPKTDATDPHLFGALRWIAKTCSGQKWFLKSLVQRVDRALPPASACTCGFERGMQCAHVVDLLCQTLDQTDRWGGVAIVASMDIVTAFDLIRHDCLAWSLLRRGVHPKAIAGLLREYLGLRGTATIPGAGTTAAFSMDMGGRQGGVDTPRELNCMVEAAMDTILPEWQAAAYGVTLPDGTAPVTHAWWADNLFLVAKSWAELQQMINDITNILIWLRLEWKPKSLKVLPGVAAPAFPSGPLRTRDLNGNPLDFEVVAELDVLGATVTGRGGGRAMVDRRLGAGTRCFWKHHALLLDRDARLRPRLEGFFRCVPAAVLHCAEAWCVDRTLCRRLRHWEQDLLGRILGLRLRPDESWLAFGVRRDHVIQMWRDRLGAPAVYHRVMFSVFRWAWRVRHPGERARTIDPLVVALQDHRPEGDWEATAAYNEVIDPRQVFSHWRHRVPGPQRTAWEHLLVAGLGPDWRRTCGEASRGDWKRLTLEAVNLVSAVWGLPGVPPRTPKADENLPAPKRRGRPKGTAKARAATASQAAVLTETKQAKAPSAEELAVYLRPERWDQPRGLLRHVVDSQLVAGWVNGTARFDGDGDNERHCQAFVAEAERNYRLAASANYEGLLLSWRPRSRNLEADWACNAALDAQTDFSWQLEPGVPPDLRQYNFTLYSDGGQRERSATAPDRRTSAYGWALRRTRLNDPSELYALGARLAEGRPTVPNLELLGATEGQLQWGRLQNGETPDTYLREAIVHHNLLPTLLLALSSTEHW